MPAIELPPLLTFRDGSPVRTPADWARRRDEVAEAIVPPQFGGMPPAPSRVEAELLCRHAVKRWGDAPHLTWRLITSRQPFFSFVLDVILPPGEGGPCATIVDGDGCWAYDSDEVKEEILRRGYALAMFNRCEIADDRKDARDAGLYRVHPDGTFGAIAAWAWGYHRVVDFLLTQDFVDKAKLVATGHSRGGKAALLAGATDTRFAVTNPNNSGCGGAGCFRHHGPRSEHLVDILKNFPFWFGAEMPGYVGRENELPFDQHFLKALCAPRDLLTTEALGDLWANPAGTFTTHAAARAVYDLLGAGERIGVVYREGFHAHSPDDWRTLLDYMDYRFKGRSPAGRSFDVAAINQPPRDS